MPAGEATGCVGPFFVGPGGRVADGLREGHGDDEKSAGREQEKAGDRYGSDQQGRRCGAGGGPERARRGNRPEQPPSLGNREHGPEVTPVERGDDCPDETADDVDGQNGFCARGQEVEDPKRGSREPKPPDEHGANAHPAGNPCAKGRGRKDRQRHGQVNGAQIATRQPCEHERVAGRLEQGVRRDQEEQGSGGARERPALAAAHVEQTRQPGPLGVQVHPWGTQNAIAAQAMLAI